MKTRDAASTRPMNTKTMNTEPMTLAFEVTVSSVQELSPNFRRITFGGYGLRDFGVHGDTLDLRIKLMIPSLAPDGSPLPLPVFEMEQSGWYREWLAMDPAVRGSMRTYTVRQARLDTVYPEIDVDPDVLYVQDDRIITSAGTAAGIDACLHLLRQVLGAEMTNRIARRMVVPPQRDGGQAQFIEKPLPQPAR